MLEPSDLLALANTNMPFGKYRGRTLIDLPEPYLLWFARSGWPAGRLGQLMELALEVRSNDLDALITPLRGKTLPESANSTSTTSATSTTSTTSTTSAMGKREQ